MLSEKSGQFGAESLRGSFRPEATEHSESGGNIVQPFHIDHSMNEIARQRLTDRESASMRDTCLSSTAESLRFALMPGREFVVGFVFHTKGRQVRCEFQDVIA